MSNVDAGRRAPLPGSLHGQVGRRLLAELSMRGWMQKDLAAQMRRPVQTISEIVRGRKRVTAETALELADALSVDALVWLFLQAEDDITRAIARMHGGR